MKLHVSGAEVAVGAFVLLGLLGFLGLYFASGGYDGLGRKWVTLRCTFGSAGGVAAGTEVQMNGIEIGLVKNVALDAAGRVEVVMFIDRKYASFVRQPDAARRLVAENRDPTAAEIDALRGDGSSMVSIAAGLLSVGSGTLIVSQGRVELPQVGAGEVLVGMPPTSILTAISGLAETLGDMAGRGKPRPGGSVAAVLQDEGRLYEQAMATVTRLDGTVGNLDATVTVMRDDVHASIDELRGTLRETRQLVETMNQRGVLGAMDGLHGTMQGQVAAMLASLQEILADVKVLSTQLPEVARDLKTLTAQLPDLAGAANKLVGGGRETMGSVNDVVSATKRFWLIKGLFEPARDEWLRARDLGPQTR